jgi:RHS repeat-associated protein
MQMVGRSFDAARSTAYRYGFNGKENDNEVKGEGNQQDYGMRIYDPRLGRFFSEDPITKKYPELTPYQFASNTPIWAIDLDGLEGLGNTTCGVYSIYTGKMMVQGDVNNDMVVDRSERESFLKAMGATYVVGSAFLADVAFTKGKASQLLFTYTPLAAAFEHNRAKTPQGRVAQDQRAKESLSEAFISYGVSSLIGGFIRMTTATKEIQYLFREEDFKKLVFDPDKGKVTADAIQELRVALTAESKIGTVKGRADQGSGADFITSIGLVDIKNVKKFIDAANGTQKEFLKMVGTMKANKNVKYVIDFEGSNLNSEQFESLMKKFYDAGVNRAQVVTTGVSSVNNTKIKTF